MDNISAEEKFDKRGLWSKMIICCLSLISVGFINSLWTRSDYKAWYEGLSKPEFAPFSSAMVGMIWTIMYITMGISIGIIWQIAKKSDSKEISYRATKGIRLFIVQIVVNMIVPIFFFVFNNLNLLLVAVFINFILVLYLIPYFYRLNKTSSFILIPYLVWLLYAIILDGSLLFLN